MAGDRRPHRPRHIGTDADQVKAETSRLRAVWAGGDARTSPLPLVDKVAPPAIVAHLDRFDRIQLEDVLNVCRSSNSLSAAGRVLFDRSRERKRSANDADRLRKYLARFDLEWAALKVRLHEASPR